MYIPRTTTLVRPRTATLRIRSTRPLLTTLPSRRLVTTRLVPSPATTTTTITQNVINASPTFQLISCGKGIDPNESTQIKNACITAVNSGASPLSRECAESIKRRLGGEWFVFVSLIGEEDYNFSLTRCKSSDYMVFTYGGKKFQVNRLREPNIQPVPIPTPVVPVQTVEEVKTTYKVLPPITLPPVYAEPVNMPSAPIVEMPLPQATVVQCNFKLISVGQGIDTNESAHIKSVCINAVQRNATPLSRFCAEGIKAGVGGDWFVFISDEMQEDYNFSLTRCKGSDFMVFVINGKKFQVCRLRGLS